MEITTSTPESLHAPSSPLVSTIQRQVCPVSTSGSNSARGRDIVGTQVPRGPLAMGRRLPVAAGTRASGWVPGDSDRECRRGVPTIWLASEADHGVDIGVAADDQEPGL